jgi:ATP-dependent DNA helicase PIF1
MILDEQQSAALEILNNGRNAFLTGSAGTGKSTVTTAFIGASFRKVDVAATTGIAALNLRDQFAAKAGRPVNVSTLYRWLGIGLGPQEGQPPAEFFNWWRGQWTKSKMAAAMRIERAECLVIDEISMLPGRLLTYMDFHCRQLRRSSEVFGGLQVVAVGDFLQLPPVDKNGTGYDWAFKSPAWRDMEAVMLHKVHRQADPEFAGLLNEFRVGRLSAAGAAVVGRRVRPFCDARIPRLFTHNAAVDKWNGAMLAELPGDAVTYTARVSGENEEQRKWLVRNLVTPYALTLKPGARVMVTANLCMKNEMVASNGTLATVLETATDAVRILTDDGNDLTLKQIVWQFDQQDDDSAKFFQIPLRLAWASTIHKSQGLTLKEAWLDIRAAREPGQAYVAMSRVKSLDGLHLKAVPGGIFTSPEAVAFYDTIRGKSGARAVAQALPEFEY